MYKKLNRLSLRACMTVLFVLAASLLQAQTVTVTGTVTERQSGEPCIGATVKVQGTAQGVITDLDGNYTLQCASGAKLEFSYVGCKTQVVAVAGKKQIDIALQPEAMALDEVVVTALGVKRQSRSLGYSTTKVGGDQFQLARDPNLGNALSGKVAGVSVAGNATGGSASRVIIRGNASLTGNNMPLYVVDGVPFDNASSGSAGTWGGMEMGDGLNNINADDIESIQVLKGAAASALYGYRGGNGAILITTKSGKKGKDMSIEVNNNLTFDMIYDTREYQKVFGQGSDGSRPQDANGAKDSETSNWGDYMDGKDAVNFLGNTYKYSYVDNWKNFYKTGVTNTTSVAISGADEKINYRVGLTNNYEKGILPNSGNRQQTINTNTTYNILPTLHFTLTANYVFEKFNGRSNLSDGNGNTNAALLWHGNSFDVRWQQRGSETAQWGTRDDGNEMISGTNVYFNNPYWLQYRKTNEAHKNRLTGSMTLKWDITDYLYLQGAVQRDGYSLEFKQVQPRGAAADPEGWLSEYEKNFYELNTNFMLGFDKEFGDFHVGATFGGNAQRNVTKQYTPSDGGRPFIVDGLWSVSNLGDKRPAKSYAEYKVHSFYGTLDLGWKNQLFLNVTARNDWFSTLAEESNSYFYPSVTASWVFTDTFKMPEWFNFGKIRASYASASNGTQPYKNILLYKLMDYTINGQHTVSVNGSEYANPALKPVRISEYEVGLNLSFLDSRLNFDMAYYVKNTKDDIASVSISNASGYGSEIANVGEIRNRGFEFMVDATPVRLKDWMWNTTVNFAINSSEVRFLGEGVQRLAIDGATSRMGSVGVYNIVGSPYGELVGYKYKRDEQGRLLLKDGLPQNNGEQVSLGNGVYKWTGGWSNMVQWKNLTLSFLIDFKFGAKLFSGTNYQAYSNGAHENTLLGRLDDPKGTYVFPGIDEATGQENKVAVRASEYWGKVTGNNIAEEFVYNASFIKLRELSLGYNFPKSIIDKIGFVKGINVSFVARNLWTIMKHTPNIDPEAAYNSSNGQGLELNGYPYTRNVGFNLNLKF